MPALAWGALLESDVVSIHRTCRSKTESLSKKQLGPVSPYGGRDHKASVWSRHQSQCIITHGTS